MSKAVQKVNKSAVIRELLAANPKATVTEIVELAKARELVVSKQAVYQVKAGRKSRKPKQTQPQIAANGKHANGKHDVVDVIRSVKALGDHVGGMDTLKQLCEALS